MQELGAQGCKSRSYSGRHLASSRRREAENWENRLQSRGVFITVVATTPSLAPAWRAAILPVPVGTPPPEAALGVGGWTGWPSAVAAQPLVPDMLHVAWSGFCHPWWWPWASRTRPWPQPIYLLTEGGRTRSPLPWPEVMSIPEGRGSSMARIKGHSLITLRPEVGGLAPCPPPQHLPGQYQHCLSRNMCELGRQLCLASENTQPGEGTGVMPLTGALPPTETGTGQGAGHSSPATAHQKEAPGCRVSE